MCDRLLEPVSRPLDKHAEVLINLADSGEEAKMYVFTQMKFKHAGAHATRATPGGTSADRLNSVAIHRPISC